jgi:hypothetical protein
MAFVSPRYVLPVGVAATVSLALLWLAAAVSQRAAAWIFAHPNRIQPMCATVSALFLLFAGGAAARRRRRQSRRAANRAI